ncbi:MAG: hypothetical protein AAF790_13365, partial [Planctomycetota bacterium]
REQREIEEALERRKQLERNKKPPPLVAGEPTPQPNNGDSPVRLVKPGHWMGATQSMVANDDNWVGEATVQVVDRSNQPIPMQNAGFAVRSGRDVALAKKQPKQVQTVFYTPAGVAKLSTRSTLRERGASLAAPPSTQPIESLKAHQHFLVVLAAEPRRYDFLRSISSVREPFAPSYELMDNTGLTQMGVQYQVVAPVADGAVLLPDNALCMTSVAYIVWDEIAPEQLSAGQRSAIVDWLHWGGELIISGPDSLDLLKDTFLDPYLPADSLGGRKISAKDLAKLSGKWRVGRRARPLEPNGEWSGLRLKLRPEAEPLPAAGNLIAERRVGRGRVLVTAMQLAERDLVNWSGGFQSLLNGLVLRRPPRRFAKNTATFIDDDGNSLERLYVKRDGPSGSALARIDATQNSKLRYFARDTHADRKALSFELQYVSEPGLFSDIESQRLKPPAVAGGVASWNDFSQAANAARAVLREAAGVSVPGSGFVVACLAAYLVVLGPLNWLVFRALGRVELAWVAAPVIALASTWVVVRQAQLDIGFVRAQTEVAILETQPGYTRGCLTRYLSFYTSLSTTYDLEFEEPTTVAAPFARTAQSPLRRGEAPTIVTYQRQERARLQGLTVSSNATEFVHSEQAFDLGGAFRYDAKRRQLTNETEHKLAAVCVVRRRTKAMALEGCWIGDLPGRSSTPVSFTPLSVAATPAEAPGEAPGGANSEAPTGGADQADLPPPAAVFAAERADDARAASTRGAERLNFEALFALALDPKHFEVGEVRAVAYLDKAMPGVAASPAASQLRGGTLLVAHLRYGPLPDPRPDFNNPVEVLAGW